MCVGVYVHGEEGMKEEEAYEIQAREMLGQIFFLKFYYENVQTYRKLKYLQ